MSSPEAGAEYNSPENSQSHHGLNSMDSMEEPELEFDETGLELAAQDDWLDWPELAREEAEASGYYQSGAMTPDGFIDEDFEDELGSPTEENWNDEANEFKDIAKYCMLQVMGDDQFGRKVIVFSACRMPPNPELNHDRLLEYLKTTVNQYVQNDYVIIYFHHGLTSRNKPSFRWLRQAYKEFDRSYKKNLQALYLVHPTRFIKLLWKLFKPVISVKFGRKVMYVNYLHDLAGHFNLNQINIPQKVRDHDIALLHRNQPTPVPTSIITPPAPTQQFNVSLQFIKDHSQDIIPPVVQQTVAYLRETGLDQEGLFRTSPRKIHLEEAKEKFNKGLEVNFDDYDGPKVASVLLKTFLKNLPEPLLTFDQYHHIIEIQSWNAEDKVIEMRRILHEELPEDNYCVLKFIFNFLTEVAAHSESNLMDTTNLSIVFGVNLIWSQKPSMGETEPINACARLLIEEYDVLFDK